MIIGITGSFGSGKTTVAGIFRKYGFGVINADRLYHGIYDKNKILKNKIKKEFGTANRAELKKIVFEDLRKLKKLNSITHPLIIKEIKNSIKKINKNIIIDAPLLLESEAKNLVDEVVVVKTNKKNSIKRALKKKKYSKKETEQIIKSQMPLRQKLKYADFVVDNNKSLKNTREQVKEIVKKINKKYHYKNLIE